MTKNPEVSNDEQFSREMMACINNNSGERQAAEEAGRQKQQADREKMRLSEIGRYALRSVATLLLVLALYKAMNASLIDSVIVIPATYICAIYFGWCLCKVERYVKKGRVFK